MKRLCVDSTDLFIEKVEGGSSAETSAPNGAHAAHASRPRCEQVFNLRL